MKHAEAGAVGDARMHHAQPAVIAKRQAARDRLRLLPAALEAQDAVAETSRGERLRPLVGTHVDDERRAVCRQAELVGPRQRRAELERVAPCGGARRRCEVRAPSRRAAVGARSEQRNNNKVREQHGHVVGMHATRARPGCRRGPWRLLRRERRADRGQAVPRATRDAKATPILPSGSPCSNHTSAVWMFALMVEDCFFWLRITCTTSLSRAGASRVVAI